MSKRHAIILANPEPNSFGHAIANAYSGAVAANGQEAVVRDLYAIGFNPVLKSAERPGHGPVTLAEDVLREVEALADAQVFVLVYPIWFGGPPAILKGYVDRVLVADFSFRQFRDQPGQSFLRGKRLASISTSGIAESWLEEKGQQAALRTVFDVYLERGFGLRDIGHLRIDRIIPNMNSAHAAEQLERVERFAQDASALLVADDHIVRP